MTQTVDFVIVAAVAENGVIGRDGELPWPSIDADKRQYRERIADSPVVLGRRTFDSMRDELPGRVQIVLSRSVTDFDIDTAYAAADVEETIEVVESLGDSLAYVIGGASIYELFQPVVDRMILSRIPGRYDGDAYFPAWDTEEWTLRERTEYDEFELETWERAGI